MSYLVVFDLDGTLLDTMSQYAQIVGRLVNDYHPDIEAEKAEQQYLDTCGAPLNEQLRKIIPKQESTHQEIENKFFQEITQHTNMKPRPDLNAVLTTLKHRGYLMAISSNNDENIIHQKMHNYQTYFIDMLGQTKKHHKGPKHFQKLATKTKKKPHEIIFIGDTPHDYEIAKQYGTHFIGITGTLTKEQFHARTQHDIPIYTTLSEITKHIEKEFPHKTSL